MQRIVIGGNLCVIASLVVSRGRSLDSNSRWLVGEAKLRSVQDDSTFENLVMAVVMGERNTEDSRRKSEAVRAGLARPRKQGKIVAARGIVAATPQELPVLQAAPALAEPPPVGGTPLPVVQG